MIEIIPIGDVDSAILEGLQQPLRQVMAQEVLLAESIAFPQGSWNESRDQHLASILLAELPSPPSSGDRVLGVVDADIFARGLNFVFGEADMIGRRALISIARLRQEFYGLPKNENLFQERALKETVHELGHTYGLKHCPNSACVMHFSNSLHDTDLKGWKFCPNCHRKVSRKA